MLQTILSSTQAKTARESLGLSQGKTATDLQLNRSYLSQFESGKRLFDDEWLKNLRQYYEANGYQFIDTPDEDGNGVRVMDCFVIPSSVNDEQADELLSQYADNKNQIQEVDQDLDEEWETADIYDIGLSYREMDIVLMMARNYALIEQLHGHEVSTPWIIEETADVDSDREEEAQASPVLAHEKTVTLEPEPEEEKSVIESFWHWFTTDDDEKAA
jgi:transcriptional regulator with XRE-family HTH domain